MKHGAAVTLSVNEEILLQMIKPEDSKELFQLVEKNRAHLREFLGWVDFNTSENDTKEFIASQEQLGDLTFCIRLKGALIGLVDLHGIDKLNHSASIGYWIDSSHQNKGIMRRSVKSLIDYGKEVLKLHRIQILCATNNTKSQKIPNALGFHMEGTLRDAIWHYKSFYDAYVYGLIL